MKKNLVFILGELLTLMLMGLAHVILHRALRAWNR
jgi:hypothetical protein